MGFVKTININFTDNLPTFPITKSLWSYLKLLLICLLELGFGFDQSLPRGQPVGKSPYYRSFDRSANWRVKDSMQRGFESSSNQKREAHDANFFIIGDTRNCHNDTSRFSVSDHWNTPLTVLRSWKYTSIWKIYISNNPICHICPLYLIMITLMLMALWLTIALMICYTSILITAVKLLTKHMFYTSCDHMFLEARK